jgi:hypothetical protein
MNEDIAVPEDEDAVFTPPNVDPPSPDSNVELSSVDESLPGTDVEDEGEPLPEFDAQYRTPFEGLLFIGKVTRTFKWLGHTFVIRTPKVDEILEIGQLHQPYTNTVSDVKAYQSLMLAATIQTVDGSPLPIPISDDVSALQSKFEYIQHHWYPWTLDKLYEEYMILDGQVRAVHDALGKA